jgi:hypothetical protein
VIAMKKQTDKLALRRHAIRVLSSRDLLDAGGGWQGKKLPITRMPTGPCVPPPDGGGVL